MTEAAVLQPLPECLHLIGAANCAPVCSRAGIRTRPDRSFVFLPALVVRFFRRNFWKEVGFLHPGMPRRGLVAFPICLSPPFYCCQLPGVSSLWVSGPNALMACAGDTMWSDFSQQHGKQVNNGKCTSFKLNRGSFLSIILLYVASKCNNTTSLVIIFSFINFFFNCALIWNVTQLSGTRAVKLRIGAI